MVISELIKKLQEVQKEHGDIEVKAYDAIYFPVDEDTFLVHNNELLIRGWYENIRVNREIARSQER